MKTLQGATCLQGVLPAPAGDVHCICTLCELISCILSLQDMRTRHDPKDVSLMRSWAAFLFRQGCSICLWCVKGKGEDGRGTERKVAPKSRKCSEGDREELWRCSYLIPEWRRPLVTQFVPIMTKLDLSSIGSYSWYSLSLSYSLYLYCHLHPLNALTQETFWTGQMRK